METHIPPKKPLKDIDSGERVYFLRIVAIFIRWGLIALPIFILLFGWIGLVLWLLVCLTLSIIVEFVTDKIGGFAAMIYKGHNYGWDVHEQMQGDLDIARVQKRSGNYDEALTTIEKILYKAPTFADALYLKAQILHEGYGDRPAALHCISRVINSTDGEAAVHRWALALKEQIQSGSMANK